MSGPVEIVAVVAIVGYVIGRQLVGEALRGRRVVLLPAVLCVIGVVDLTSDKVHAHLADVACLAVGTLIVAAIGVGQGLALRLESRQGGLWGQLPITGLWWWLLLIGSRLAMTLTADALGATVAAGSSTVLLTFGVNRLAQAAVVTARAMRSGIPFAPEKDGKVFLAGVGVQGVDRGFRGHDQPRR